MLRRLVHISDFPNKLYPVTKNSKNTVNVNGVTVTKLNTVTVNGVTSNVEWCNTENGNLSKVITGIVYFSLTLLQLTELEHFWTFLLVRLTAVMIWWLVMMCLETNPRLCPQALTNGGNFWNSLTAPVVISLANRDIFCFTAGWPTLKSNSLGYFLSNKISASSVDSALYHCCTDFNIEIRFSLEWIFSGIIMLQAATGFTTKVQVH